jgi:glycosyltransferase involved in cell wall biosynthesis
MEEKVRILMVMASPFRSGLAPENYIRAKAIYENTSTEVDIMCFPYGEDIEETNVHILRVPKKKLFKSFQIGEYKKIIVYTLLINIKLLFKKDKKYDIIFLFNAAYLFFWILKPLFKGRVVPVIYNTLQNELLKWNVAKGKKSYSIIQKTEIKILKKYDALLFNSMKFLEIFSQRNIDREKMHMIPFASETNFDIENDITSNYNLNKAFKILYAGSFIRIQNIDLIYAIASNLINYNIEFNLVGANDTELISEREKILDLPNVKIYKRLNQEDLKNFYREANVLISCRTEGENDLPFKIIEYMSWGKCILATDLPIHNLFLNKRIACMVEPDPEIMSNQILKLMKNPELTRQYEKNVREYFMENYSFNLMKEKYNNLIEVLLSQNSKNK